MLARAFWFYVTLGVSLLAGCSLLSGGMMPPPPPPPRPASASSAVTSRPRAGLDGKEVQVNLLARAFLPGAEPAEKGFAYYAYLLFSGNDKPTAAARLGATVAYLDMFNDVSVAGAESGTPKHMMAVLYAPVRSDQANGLAGSRDPEAMLRAYNYDRAHVIVNALRREGRKVPDVALVGCRQPLDQGSTVDSKDVTVVDLMLSDGDKVRGRLKSFQDKLEAGKTDLDQGGENVVFRALRSWFDAVGGAEETVSKLINIS
jgi:hypothetical protein